jgi:hypothetical protein
MSYKLFSDELIEACWNHPERWTGYTREEFNENAVCNMNAMHEYLIEKGFSQLDIDNMKFVPLRPNGPNNDWVIPEGFKEYEIDGGIEGYLVYVKEGSEAEEELKTINNPTVGTRKSELKLWSIYGEYSDDVMVFEPNSAEWLISELCKNESVPKKPATTPYKFNELNAKEFKKHNKYQFRHALIAGGFTELDIKEMDFVKYGSGDKDEEGEGNWDEAPYIPKGAKVFFIGCDTEVILLEDDDHVLRLLEKDDETYMDDEVEGFKARLKTLNLSEMFGTSKFCLYDLGNGEYTTIKEMMEMYE